MKPANTSMLIVVGPQYRGQLDHTTRMIQNLIRELSKILLLLNVIRLYIIQSQNNELFSIILDSKILFIYFQSQ